MLERVVLLYLAGTAKGSFDRCSRVDIILRQIGKSRVLDSPLESELTAMQLSNLWV